MRLDNTIFFITGHTGVGKLAVGRELHSLMNKDDAFLLDNQKIALSLFEAAGVTNTNNIREGILPRIFHDFHREMNVIFGAVMYAPPDASYIFTNPLISGDSKARGMLDSLQLLAEDRGALFIPVVLHCSDEKEHMGRLMSEEREKSLKLRNPEIFKAMMSDKDIYIPTHPHTLQIDTAGCEPENVALEIIDHVRDLRKYAVYYEADYLKSLENEYLPN